MDGNLGEKFKVTDSVDVLCQSVSREECVEAGRLVDKALEVLSSLTGISKPRILLVVVRGASVLVMSVFEVLRDYDAVGAMDLGRDRAVALFQVLHNVIELVIRRLVGQNIPRWLLEGIPSAVALEVLRRIDGKMFGRVYELLRERGCVEPAKLMEWKHPVEIKPVEVLSASGEGAEETAKRVAELIAKSLPLELLAHLRGEDVKYYLTSALLPYSIGSEIGFDKLMEMMIAVEELKRIAEKHYQRVCGKT